MTKIAVTGVPGTGKTTVAKLLSKKLGYKYLDLNKLAQEKNLYKGQDKKREVKIVDIDKIKKESKDNIVLDSHYSHLLSPDLTIILKLDVKELRKRLKQRGYTEEKIQENVDAQIMEIISLESKGKIIEIEVTNKSPEDIVKEIEKIFKAYNKSKL